MVKIYYIKLKNNNIYRIKKVNKIKKGFKEINFSEKFFNECKFLKQIAINPSFKIYLKNKKVVDKFYYTIDDSEIIDSKNNYFLLYKNELEKNKKLVKNIDKEKQANNFKTIFLQSMSHDIRTPMNAIMGFTELALKFVEDSSKVEDYLQKILISSNHLLNLINNILDMSKIESGNLSLENKKCSLRDLVFDIKNVFINLIKEKNLIFEIKTINLINEDIYTDMLKLKQVFINLISNSIKYSLNGCKIEFIINQLNFSQNKCNYKFIVKDNGLGMGKEFINTAFDAFSREKKVNNIQGTGLGLTIVNEIIKKMGGSIDVNSSLGEGSEFIVNLCFEVNEINMIQKLKDFEDLKILYLSFNNIENSIFDELSNANIILEKYCEVKDLKTRLNQCEKFETNYDLCLIDEDYYFNNINLLFEIKKNFEFLPFVLIKNTSLNNNFKNIDIIIDKPIMLSDFIELFINSDLQKKRSCIVKKNANNKNILIVDDNELNREMAKEILKIEGYNYEEASNGEEALNLIISNKIKYFDLVLMDIQMPIMDGIQCANYIKKMDNENSKIPIIAMTANAFEEEKENILNNGFNNYLSKPIKLDNLLNVIKEYIN